MSYGHKSNEELMLSYGFVLPNNKANFAMLTLGTAAQAAGGQLYMLSLLTPVRRT